MNKFSYDKVIKRYCKYDKSWEDVSTYAEQDIKLGRVTPEADLREYRISEPGVPHNLISRRVSNVQ
jgi:hypothetical protein